MGTQNKAETVWFEGVKWSDVNGDGGNNKDQSLTLYSSDKSTEASPSKTVFSDNSIRVKTEKNAVAAGSELQLGLLLSFPPDIIVDILSRLPASDLMRGRTVCKSWNKLTKEPYFLDLQVNRTMHQPHSYLLKQSILGSGNKLHMVDSAGDNWRSKGLPLPLNSYNGGNVNLSNSCNGLFVISRIDGENPVIYNPITKDCVPLPKSEFEPRKTFAASLSSYALGFDSSSKKYKVVRVYNIYHDIEIRRFHTKAEIITLGENSWRKLDFPYKVTHEDTIKSVFLNGSFHWAIYREANISPLPHILVLDITSEKFQTIIFPPSIEIPIDVELINLGGSLALVRHCDFSNDLLQAWRIEASRDNGGRFCYFCIHTSVIDVPYIRGLTLLSVLNNGDFLCKALQTSEVGPSFSAFCNHLVRYCPQKNEGYIQNIPGVPRLFYATPFVPSLASPNICFLKEEQNQN